MNEEVKNEPADIRAPTKPPIAPTISSTPSVFRLIWIRELSNPTAKRIKGPQEIASVESFVP